MMHKKLLFLFAVLLTVATAQATDYYVAELSGTTLTFKKTTTAPDNEISWDATNTGTSYPDYPGWYRTAFSRVVIDASFAEAKPTSCYYWFQNNLSYDALSGDVGDAVSSITGLEYLNTSNVTTMAGMFYNCKDITSLDLSTFDTGNVTNMAAMFYGCFNINSLDLSSFDTSKVTNMDWMFQECNHLESLDVTSFNTSRVTSMIYMFGGCALLTSLDLSSFDTRNVTDMDFMFWECQRLKSLDLSSFNTSNVERMEQMFSECCDLVTLDLSNFDK